MDIWNCRERNTRTDRVLFHVATKGLALCFALGLPFLLLVALGVVK